VGIDVDRADKLVTTGIFALSRNPIYVAFGCVLIGQFLFVALSGDRPQARQRAGCACRRRAVPGHGDGI
jgi:hypothetical protein